MRCDKNIKTACVVMLWLFAATVLCSLIGFLCYLSVSGILLFGILYHILTYGFFVMAIFTMLRSKGRFVPLILTAVPIFVGEFLRNETAYEYFTELHFDHGIDFFPEAFAWFIAYFAGEFKMAYSAMGICLLIAVTAAYAYSKMTTDKPVEKPDGDEKVYPLPARIMARTGLITTATGFAYFLAVYVFQGFFLSETAKAQMVSDVSFYDIIKLFYLLAFVIANIMILKKKSPIKAFTVVAAAQMAIQLCVSQAVDFGIFFGYKVETRIKGITGLVSADFSQIIFAAVFIGIYLTFAAAGIYAYANMRNKPKESMTHRKKSRDYAIPILHKLGGNSMDILVVGGGGREHAIIMKLNESTHVNKIYCAPGNGGISHFAECFPEIKATDVEGMVALAKRLKPDMVVVAPDDPLVLGMADALEEAGFMTFGPHKNAAIIEGSKVFSKDLMKKYNIPTAGYEVFSDPKAAMDYIKAQNTYPTVIKADGLALGKGVVIAQDENEAADAIHSIMEDKIFGKSGSEIVIEEFLTGPEVSVLSFTDGTAMYPMVSSMDHKRALDNDEGLNTGGMGTIAPNPFFTEEIAAECMEKIFLPTMNAMNAEGRTFKGCLYFGLMLTQKGPKVIEYNCRFGDPEAQVVLPLLETDIMDIFEAIYKGTLSKLDVKWKKGAAACVIAASGGYPKKYATGIEISGLDKNGQVDGAFVYHAGTKIADGKLVTAGGRVLGVTATGDDLSDALDKAYAAVKKVSFEGMHYRNDIGKRALSAAK